MERQQAKVLNSDETDIIGEIYVNYFTMLDLSGHKKAQKKIDEMFGVLWGQDGLPKNDCIRICVFVDHNRKEYRIYIGNHEKCYDVTELFKDISLLNNGNNNEDMQKKCEKQIHDALRNKDILNNILKVLQKDKQSLTANDFLKNCQKYNKTKNQYQVSDNARSKRDYGDGVSKISKNDIICNRCWEFCCP